MVTKITQEHHLAHLSRVRRVKGQPDDRYAVLFLDQQDRLLVPLTEWYRLRSTLGPISTRNTYLTCLLPYFTFLSEKECPWNAPPAQLRSVLVEFYRDRLGCLIRPERDQASIGVVPTHATPLRESTLRVLRAALRDFYLIMRDEGLYAFSNPLSSETLLHLKRTQNQSIANAGAPDHAGIRGEPRSQSRRQPTAFIQHPSGENWQPELRRELVDVREGMHTVLNTLVDSDSFPLREKAVLELLRNTGARLHEIVGMTVGGYKNKGIAGQAQVVNKGSMGREIKTIYFAQNPRVQQFLSAYLERVRPLYDPHGQKRLADIDEKEPFFLTERGTAYSVKAFYYFWYKHYPPLQASCPVHFAPHDIRHLFISEHLLRLRQSCILGTKQFDAERYQREREAFASLIMGWHDSRTIDIYDHTRDGEHALSVLATYQQDLTERRSVSETKS